MRKETYEQYENEILSDDGIFSAKKSTYLDNAEKCCHCGFELLPGEEAVEILVNGDVIHKSCWNEYADENSSVFGKDFIFCDGDVDCY